MNMFLQRFGLLLKGTVCLDSLGEKRCSKMLMAVVTCFLFSMTRSVFFGTPGIVPACCQSVRMNVHDQLQVHVADKVNTVDSVHLFCQVLQKPQVKVMQDMDGIEIEMPCACCVCGVHIKLVAAGVPTSVQEVMMVQQENI